ncbi:MAG: hypothetical protein WA082_03515 [Candidatus Moraniibacteriota bacterium]
MMRLLANDEIKLFERLREYFGIPAELPLGISQDGDIKVNASAVTSLIWIGFSIAENVHKSTSGSAETGAALYSDLLDTKIEGLRDDLTSRDCCAELTLEGRRYFEECLEMTIRERETILRIAQKFPDALSEICCHYCSDIDVWNFFGYLVGGQTHHQFYFSDKPLFARSERGD